MKANTQIFLLAERQSFEQFSNVIRDISTSDTVSSGDCKAGSSQPALQIILAESVSFRDIQAAIGALPQNSSVIWMTHPKLSAETFIELANVSLSDHPRVLVCGPTTQEKLRQVLPCVMGEIDFGETRWEIDIELMSSDIDLGKLTFPLAEWLFKQGLINQSERSSLQLVFQEAVTNSMEHGNLELCSEWKEQFLDDGTDVFSIKKAERLADPTFGQRLIRIKTSFENKQLVLIVEDQGQGFDVNLIQQRRANLEASFGRGFYLINAFMDRVEFNERGNQIKLYRRIDHDV